LVILDHALGLPVLRTLSLCTCCRHCPGAAAGRTLRSSRPAVSAFPERVVGSACTSSFSRFARRSLALRPAHSRGHQFVARYTEGFSHFVTSMTAPVASGWSESPGGPFTHWNAPPFTAHTLLGHSDQAIEWQVLAESGTSALECPTGASRRSLLGIINGRFPVGDCNRGGAGTASAPTSRRQSSSGQPILLRGKLVAANVGQVSNNSRARSIGRITEIHIVLAGYICWKMSTGLGVCRSSH
jgi:hypothetical protein